MIAEFFKIIAKLAALTSGIVLIALIIMWFGCIPMIATITGELSGWMYLFFTALMVGLIILIMKWLKD